MKIPMYDIRHKWLPLAIIVVVTLLSLQLVQPVFEPGIPTNIDLPGKYERSWCYQDFSKETGIYSLITTMCRYKNTGDAVFQSYPPLFYLLIQWLSHLTGLELAFKLMLVFTYFLPALGALLLLYLMKKPLEGSFAYGLLLLELGGWHKGGFEQTFNVGMTSNAMATGFFVVTVGLLIWMLQKPSAKRFVLATIAATATFLAHGIPFVFFFLCLIPFGILHRKKVKKHWKPFIILFPLIFFLLIGFWLVPYLVKWSYFGSGTTTHMDISGIRDFFWRNINTVTFTLGIIGMVLLNYLGFKNKTFKHRKTYAALTISALIIPVLWIWSMNWFESYKTIFKLAKFLVLIRLHAELRVFIFIFAALLLGYIAVMNIKINKKKVPIGIIVALLLFYTAISAGYPLIKAHSQSIKTHTSQDFQYMYAILPGVEDATGRVLVQDTLYNFGAHPQYGIFNGAYLSHTWTLAPVLTGQEFLGALPWYYYKYGYEYSEENRIFEKRPSEYTKEELHALLEKLNVQYIIGYHPLYREGLDDWYTIRGALRPQIEGYYPLVIYQTNITPSYFSIDETEGKIIEESYSGLRDTYVKVSANKPTTVTFKTLSYPNWHLEVDGKKKPFIERSDGHMDVMIEPGTHTITYNYRMLPVDWLSYLLPIAGLYILFMLWQGKYFRKEFEAEKQ